MSKIEQVIIPQLMLEIDPDATIVSHIGIELGRLSIEKEGLIYCGIEGTELEDVTDTESLGSYDSTFARTWEDLMSEAERNDKYPETDPDYPLSYARSAWLPAIITYDKNELRESNGSIRNLWLPKTGLTISNAARALIFFK